MNVSNLLKGFVAGLAATLVLSGLMMMKSAMGVMPELDVTAMLSKMMGTPLAGGWVAHFVIGTFVWGGLFAWFNPMVPGKNQWLKGITFGIVAWLLMMVIIMPMAGAGLFGMNFGVMAPVMTFVLHVIFGAVLGGAYAAQLPAPVLGDLNQIS